MSDAPSFQGQSGRYAFDKDGIASFRNPQEELYKYLLNHMQGTFGTESQIDYVAPNGEANPEALRAGKVAYLDSEDKTFKLYDGVNSDVFLVFLKPAGGYHGVPGTGNVYGDGVLGLPVVAPYRLCTNVYEATSYAVGTPLTVSGEEGTLGEITPGVYYTNNIVGVVAGGILADYDKPGRDVLEFFTYWLPAGF